MVNNKYFLIIGVLLVSTIQNIYPMEDTIYLQFKLNNNAEEQKEENTHEGEPAVFMQMPRQKIVTIAHSSNTLKEMISDTKSYGWASLSIPLTIDEWYFILPFLEQCTNIEQTYDNTKKDLINKLIERIEGLKVPDLSALVKMADFLNVPLLLNEAIKECTRRLLIQKNIITFMKDEHAYDFNPFDVSDDLNYLIAQEIKKELFVESSVINAPAPSNISQPISAIVLSKDNKILYFASRALHTHNQMDDTIKMYDIKNIESPRLLETIDTDSFQINSLQLIKNNTFLVSGSLDGAIVIYDLLQKKIVSTINQANGGHQFGITDVHSDYNDSLLFSAADDGEVKIFDIQNLSNPVLLSTLLVPHANLNTKIAVNADKDILAICNRKRYYLYSIQNKHQPIALPTKKETLNSTISAVTMNKTGTILFLALNNGLINMYDITDQNNIKFLKTADGFFTEGQPIISMVLNKDNTKLIIGSSKGLIKILSIQDTTVTQLQTIVASTAWISTLAISYDGSLFISGSDSFKQISTADNRIKIFSNLADNYAIQTLPQALLLYWALHYGKLKHLPQHADHPLYPIYESLPDYLKKMVSN